VCVDILRDLVNPIKWSRVSVDSKTSLAVVSTLFPFTFFKTYSFRTFERNLTKVFKNLTTFLGYLKYFQQARSRHILHAWWRLTWKTGFNKLVLYKLQTITRKYKNKIKVQVCVCPEKNKKTLMAARIIRLLQPFKVSTVVKNGRHLSNFFVSKTEHLDGDIVDFDSKHRFFKTKKVSEIVRSVTILKLCTQNVFVRNSLKVSYWTSRSYSIDVVRL